MSRLDLVSSYEQRREKAFGGGDRSFPYMSVAERKTLGLVATIILFHILSVAERKPLSGDNHSFPSFHSQVKPD
jgi:hypothetical protein